MAWVSNHLALLVNLVEDVVGCVGIRAGVAADALKELFAGVNVTAGARARVGLGLLAVLNERVAGRARVAAGLWPRNRRRIWRRRWRVGRRLALDQVLFLLLLCTIPLVLLLALTRIPANYLKLT